MGKLQIDYIPIAEIVPYKNNPRKNDQAVDVVAKSIKQFGFRNPIVIDKDNIIVAGHTRLKAASKLNMQEVPVIWADDLTPDQVKAFRIMDNKSIEFAEWDNDLLKEEFYALEGTDSFDFTGFTTDEISKIWDKEVKEDDFEVPKEPKYKVEMGDTYQLGEHRLMCGDATKKEQVEALMGENKADMVFTDPPYNVDYEPFLYGWFDKRNWNGPQNETDIWDFRRDKPAEYGHPTQKPVELSSKAIKNSTKNKDSVLDLFGGSGSTLIACEQTKRKCFMMEIDPFYCSVIIERWEKLTGKKGVKTN